MYRRLNGFDGLEVRAYMVQGVELRGLGFTGFRCCKRRSLGAGSHCL